MTLYGYTKAGYTQSGYTAEDYDSYWTQASLRFWRPRIKVYDRDLTTLLHDYNPFSSSNDITFERCTVEHSMNSPGTAELVINDRLKDVDRSKVGQGNKIICQISQDGVNFYNIFNGFCENLIPMRDRRDGLRYGLRAFGTGILLNNVLTWVQKAATRKQFGKVVPDPNDPRMRIWRLAKDLFEKTDYLVNKDKTISQMAGGLDTSGIDSEISESLMSLNVRYQPASVINTHLIDRAGLVFDIDPNNKVWMTYPQKYLSPVTLKTLDENNKAGDKITTTSYFYGPWEYEIPSDNENFANVLVAVSGTEPLPGPTQTDDGDGNSGTPCHDQENCQEIICNIPDLTFLSLLLKKVGTLTKKFIQGVIWSSFNDRPAQKLATFNMDISHLIDGIPAPCFASNITKTANNVTISTGDHIYISIKPIGDQQNTIVWIHDGKVQVKITRSGSRPKTTPGPDEEGEPPFDTSNNAVSYTYATGYNVRTRVVVQNDASIQRYGRHEKFIDVRWTTDFNVVNDILMVMLQYMSKPPMIFNTEKVTISAPPLRPAQSVRVIDPIAGLAEGVAQKAIVTNTAFDFDAYDEFGFGTWFYEVGLQGLYDFKAVESKIFAKNMRLSCQPII